jgi:hypothetical protein
MNTVGKFITAGLMGGAALSSSADAIAQEKKPGLKPETTNEVRLTDAEVQELKGNTLDLTRLLAAKTNSTKPDAFSTAELSGRARVEANRITTKDTALAPTIEAIASEVAKYGLLQTKQEKIDFAKKVQEDMDDNVSKGLKNSGTEGQLFLKGIQWLENPKRDSLFNDENGYTRKRLIVALVNSPNFEEAIGSLYALSKKETNVPFVTTFNEQLIRESKVASTVKPTDKDFVSINR